MLVSGRYIANQAMGVRVLCNGDVRAPTTPLPLAAAVYSDPWEARVLCRSSFVKAPRPWRLCRLLPCVEPSGWPIRLKEARTVDNFRIRLHSLRRNNKVLVSKIYHTTVNRSRVLRLRVSVEDLEWSKETLSKEYPRMMMDRWRIRLSQNQ